MHKIGILALQGAFLEHGRMLDGHIVAARQRNMLATSFHPELNDDPRIHRWFIEHLIEKPE